MISTKPAAAPTPKPHERRSTRLDGSMGITGDDAPTARNLDEEEAAFERRWAETVARRAAERASSNAAGTADHSTVNYDDHSTDPEDDAE